MPASEPSLWSGRDEHQEDGSWGPYCTALYCALLYGSEKCEVSIVQCACIELDVFLSMHRVMFIEQCVVVSVV